MERLKILQEESTGEARREPCGPGCGCWSGETEAAKPLTAEAAQPEPAGLAAHAEERAAEGGELAEIRQRLAGMKGKKLWRSLDELAGNPGFQEMLHREFPRHASEWVEGEGGFSRRRFLQLSSASMALAGLTACTRQPNESIVPYVEQPEYLVPGKPLYFATAFPMAGSAQGVLVESHTGRPTKVEGNPDHPSNPGGGTDTFAQASILQLYDPDRSDVITYLGDIRSWKDFQRAVEARLSALSGGGLRVLTGAITSPTLADQLDQLRQSVPGTRVYQWEAAGRHNAHDAATRSGGRPVDAVYDLAEADVIVSLDADFLAQGPNMVRNAHAWAERRRAAAGAGGEEGVDAEALNRLYVLEGMPSNTGSVADHRMAATPAEIARFTLALAGRVGAGGGGDAEGLSEEARRWVAAIADDLRSHSGRAVVVAGDGMPPAVHSLAQSINSAIGAVGTAVRYVEPLGVSGETRPTDGAGQAGDLRALVRELEAGEVDTLLILGTNPVFDAPADLNFAEAITKAQLRIHAGLYQDETAEYCQWHVPMAHFLESWSDARSIDGAVSIIQPLIQPLYGGHTAHEILAQLTGQPEATAQELVRERWRGRLGDDRAWRRALHDGFVESSDPDSGQGAGGAAPGGVGDAAADVAALSSDATGEYEIAFRPDPAVWDGSWANSGWLQELPRPVTRLTWDNAALMSPATAAEIGVDGIDPDLVHHRPMVTVTVGERSMDLPVWVVPGHADGAVTIHFGQGRRRGGSIADGVGFDVYPLRTSAGLWNARGGVAKAAGTYPMGTTQDHFSMEGRHLVRSGTYEKYAEDPEFVEHMGHHIPDASFYEEWDYPGYKWGLAVDLNVCTGCSSCVVACQSENNIPVVGKEQVIKGREMHWLRIDRYFEGEDEEHVSGLHNQPVLCMQCEQAPCEVVCPVAATVHSSEGLNDMVYNRCVGTRYCSNNCPYKVRRFNFLKYTDHTVESLKMMRNPDVTVRARGVMEKCTYCVQRINHARIEAKVDGQRGRSDGKIPRDSVQTACQQACPSGAIAFGDLNDPDSEVARRKAEHLNYTLLDDLATKPRTSYLAKLRNPNPALEPISNGSEHGSH